MDMGTLDPELMLINTTMDYLHIIKAILKCDSSNLILGTLKFLEFMWEHHLT